MGSARLEVCLRVRRPLELAVLAQAVRLDQEFRAGAAEALLAVEFAELVLLAVKVLA